MWDKDKIESLFPQQIANRILGIPLFDMVEEDKLIWVDSTYGQYREGAELGFTGGLEWFVENSCSSEGQTFLMAHM
jgi:hypothetical protein